MNQKILQALFLSLFHAPLQLTNNSLMVSISSWLGVHKSNAIVCIVTLLYLPDHAKTDFVAWLIFLKKYEKHI